MTLPNYNGPMRNFIPNHMGGPGGGKGATSLRECHVVDGVNSTYVIPGDWPDDIQKWGAPGTHFKTSNNNLVKYFCATDLVHAGGYDTYKAMKEAFATATGEGHFIVLIGWSHGLDFPLDGDGRTPKGTGNTMREIWTAKAAAKVMIRTLLWREGGTAGTAVAGVEKGVKEGLDPFPTTGGKEYEQLFGILDQNGRETEFINTLNVKGSSPARAIGVWDDRTVSYLGAHHQKILVVYGNQGLIAFFGGVDIYPSRVIPDSDGSPQHDVHCRVEGDAASDLLDLCIDRWNACPMAAALESADTWRGIAKARGVLPAIGPGTPHQQVQIGHTRGNPAVAYPSDGYPMLEHCIQTARKFIYMQDQYLWSQDCAIELNKAVRNLEHLIIVVPDPLISDPKAGGMILRRKAVRLLIAGLSPKDLQKINIYCPTKPGDPGTYVHSKIWIFDDECAIVGSSNCNNRGYTHDSEVMGRVSEGNIRLFDDLDMNFAHKLRMMLWHHHLGGYAPMEDLYYPSSVCYFPLQLWSLAVSRETDDFGRFEDYSKYESDAFFAKWVLKHPIGNLAGGANLVFTVRHYLDPD